MYLIQLFYNNSIYIYNLSIFFINLYCYVLLLFTFISIIFFCNFLNLKSINQFKNFYKYKYIMYSILYSLLSLAGIPPLLGFNGKLLIVIALLLNMKYLLLFSIICLNMFSMYFYIQNIRFVINKENKINFLSKTYYMYINTTILYNINILNFINIFSIFFINDILRFFFLLNSFIYF